MFNVVLFQPEIPPNTGNVMRLCANTGVALHLVEPLGFALDDRRLRRAGLDDAARDVQRHRDFGALRRALPDARIHAFTTRGREFHTRVRYAPGDVLLFGPETRGLPASLLATLPSGQHLRLPMVAGSRSLNLANAVAVAVYEAWRQHAFSGAA